MMTMRERILAVLDGKSPDWIPWTVRLDLWYNGHQAKGTLPERFKGMSVEEVQRAVGCGDPARYGRVFKTRLKNVEMKVTQKGNEIQREWITPVGTVSQLEVKGDEVEHFVAAGLPRALPIKRAEDYAVQEYIYENTYYEPAYEEYLAYEQKIGDDGYPMVAIGDVPFHHFLMRLSGYDNAYFELNEHLNEVEHLIKVMEQVEMARLWPVALDSPAKWLRHGVHFDTQMTPPRLFAKYIKPYYEKIAPEVHRRGKRLAYHADHDSKLLLNLVKESGYDMAECLSTAPLVSLTLEEARRAWGTQVMIYGGVPSTILEESEMTDEEFEAYMRNVFKNIAPGDAIILGVADNVLPISKIERIERVSQMVQEYGKYPITIS